MFVPSYQFFLPGRQYTQEEARAVMEGRILTLFLS